MKHLPYSLPQDGIVIRYLESRLQYEVVRQDSRLAGPFDSRTDAVLAADALRLGVKPLRVVD